MYSFEYMNISPQDQEVGPCAVVVLNHTNQLLC